MLELQRQISNSSGMRWQHDQSLSPRRGDNQTLIAVATGTRNNLSTFAIDRDEEFHSWKCCKCCIWPLFWLINGGQELAESQQQPNDDGPSPRVGRRAESLFSSESLYSAVHNKAQKSNVECRLSKSKPAPQSPARARGRGRGRATTTPSSSAH